MNYQKKVIFQIAIGLCLIAALITTLWPLFEPPTPNERVIYTLRWTALFSIPLLFGIHTTLFTRFMSQDLIQGYKSKVAANFNNAYLNNTMEQTSINVLSAISLGMLAPPTLIKLVPIQCCIFIIGRAVYYLTYKSNPMNRFVGFVMGYYVAILSMFASLYWAFARVI